jgi:hypothetical protein
MQWAGLAMHFPADTVFHLAEFRHIGRRLDSDMPVGEWYEARLSYNFFVAECDGMFIRFRTTHDELGVPRCHIARYSDLFTVTFSWEPWAPDTECRIAVFSSMDEAVADLQCWLENEAGVRKLRDRDDVPDWVHDIRLVVTADMMRCNWEIAHDYQDVLNLAGEMAEIIDPKCVMFYLTGWHGPIDLVTDYTPHPDLGGEEGFRGMMDGLHELGFRVLGHTLSWSAQHHLPEIEEVEEIVRREEDGLPAMFEHPSRPLKFRTGRIRLEAPAGARSFSFKTPAVPAGCRALFVLGGVKGKGTQVRLNAGRSSVITPPGWFENHDEYAFPYPLWLNEGENVIEVMATGGSEIDWSEGWYRIRYTYVAYQRYISWTMPIPSAQFDNPKWIERWTDGVSAAVKKYSIDAVHVDASTMAAMEGLLLRLKEKAPAAVICGEVCNTLRDVDYWVFQHNCTQTLSKYPGMRTMTCEQSAVPLESLDEEFAWMEKTSPVCRFAKDYMYTYPHLCASNAFVPVGKVCSNWPDRLMPRHKDELWKILRDAKRLDYIPGIRVNYRDYGLDEDSKKAMVELVSGGSRD